MTQEELDRLEALEKQLSEILNILLPILRAQAMAATTVSHKWQQLEGETFFRRVNEKKSDTIQSNGQNR